MAYQRDTRYVQSDGIGVQGTGRDPSDRGMFEAFVMDAPRVARVGFDAMMKGKPVAIPGLRNKLIPIAARVTPRSLIATLSHRAARP